MADVSYLLVFEDYKHMRNGKRRRVRYPNEPEAIIPFQTKRDAKRRLELLATHARPDEDRLLDGLTPRSYAWRLYRIEHPGHVAVLDSEGDTGSYVRERWWIQEISQTQWA